MKVLFITLSNIGDVVLTLPVLDVVRQSFPQARVTVMVGPRPKQIFENNPAVSRVIVFDKRAKLKEKISLFKELKKENFDLVIDLRNSLFGAWLPAPYKTSPFRFSRPPLPHMKQRHLHTLQRSGVPLGGAGAALPFPKEAERNSLFIAQEDEQFIRATLEECGVKESDRIIVVAPGARSHTKRWPREKFVDLVPHLAGEFSAKIVLVGDREDAPVTKYIAGHAGSPIVDLGARTTLTQLAALLKRSALLITNDSAALHLASYLGIPVVALFGPSNELKYGPWSSGSRIVRKDIACRPCEKAQCKFGTLECLSLIKVEDVLRQVREAVVSRQAESGVRREDFKRILIVRTDRIGDVLLSTPVVKALRDAYPHAYIAMMVSPYARDIVEGSPYLDQVIIYDKEGKHRSWQRSIVFARNLKKKRFSAAFILHPINRVHLITFFAGISRRIGFERKLGVLLTDRIPHTKQLGEKHELEYTLDVVRSLGIEPKDPRPFVPIKQESEKWVERLFAEEGIRSGDTLAAVHPGASCPSKIWPVGRFAEVADRLIEKYKCRVLIVAGPKDTDKAKIVFGAMHHPAINLAGKTSVSQLASVLKRCRIFISNDSGPVHIASGVGTPVISLFGRSQKGLSPKRWGPVGQRDKALHKYVGCIECLAHNCVKDFACLKAITVEDVLQAVETAWEDK